MEYLSIERKYNMDKLNEDIEIAKGTIIGLDRFKVGLDSNEDLYKRIQAIRPFRYDEFSYIYKFTNENLKDTIYKNLISNNENVLSVIGGGDQILNMYLFNSNNIDAFDISRFPSYYLRLKIAAIKEFKYEEYLKFFCEGKPFNKKLFDRLMKNCDDPICKTFWTSVCLDDPEKVYESPLFNTVPRNKEYAIRKNPYLDRFNYDLLKSKIDKLNINYINEDILSLASKLDKDYDLIYLSNICMYSREMFNSFGNNRPFSEFKDLITNLRITPNGKVINYLHAYLPWNLSHKVTREVFNTEGFITYEVDNDREQPDALLVYRKVRK